MTMILPSLVSLGLTLIVTGFAVWTWFAKKWLIAQLESYLENDKTPLAVYQHRLNEKLDALSARVDEMHADIRTLVLRDLISSRNPGHDTMKAQEDI